MESGRTDFPPAPASGAAGRELLPRDTPPRAADKEQAAVRLARMEGKLDSHFARLEERMLGMEQRLSERFHSHEGRIAVLEKSLTRQGERIGKLEADAHRFLGGWLACSKILATGIFLGGLAVQLLARLRP